MQYLLPAEPVGVRADSWGHWMYAHGGVGARGMQLMANLPHNIVYQKTAKSVLKLTFFFLYLPIL